MTVNVHYDFGGGFAEVGITGNTSNRADQVRPPVNTSCRSDQMYLEEKVGGEVFN